MKLREKAEELKEKNIFDIKEYKNLKIIHFPKIAPKISF